MHIVHLTASPFFGGPERQMLGLAGQLPPRFVSTFLSFPENGRSAPFLAEARRRNFPALPLAFDTPRVRDAVRELTYLLRTRAADVLVTHTYKPNVLGRVAALRVGIPHVIVSRGWTGETLKVRMYEAMDRFQLKYADRVVAVSEGQASKVRRCGVAEDRLTVIRNAARPELFRDPLPNARSRLHEHFSGPVSHVVLAAGRLSPEKGFRYLVETAARVREQVPGAGFLVFGEGSERPRLERMVAECGLTGRFLLPGFSATFEELLPGADVVVLPSLTEGLPNVALEASAAGVPVVATAVGGTPEAVVDGETGYLVAPRNPGRLADRVIQLLSDDGRRERFGRAGSRRMKAQFSFTSQARQYADLFESLRLAQRFAA